MGICFNSIIIEKIQGIRAGVSRDKCRLEISDGMGREKKISFPVFPLCPLQGSLCHWEEARFLRVVALSS